MPYSEEKTCGNWIIYSRSRPSVHSKTKSMIKLCFFNAVKNIVVI